MAPLRRLPPSVLASLDDAGRTKARGWWEKLNREAQEVFLQLWDERSDETSLYGEVQADGSVEWKELPLQLRGLIIEGRTDARRGRWDEDLYEYLVSHPEAVVLVNGRTFHVCRAHPVAREVLRCGVLPGHFKCPVDHAQCPMLRIVRESKVLPTEAVRFQGR